MYTFISFFINNSFSQVRVPSSCLPSSSSGVIDNNVHPDYTLEPEDDASMPLSNKCYYDSAIREEYSQWTPVNDSCSICTCYKGAAKCEAVVCPVVDCINPVLLTGECCRTCLSKIHLRLDIYME